MSEKYEIPKTISEILKLEGDEKINAFVKIQYVKSKVHEIVISNNNELFSFTENNNVYLDVLKIESVNLQKLDDIDDELKVKLDNISYIISQQITNIISKMDSELVPLNLSEIGNFEFHNIRSSLENRLYQEIKKQKNIVRGVVYLYRDMELYGKLRDLCNLNSNPDLEEIYLEFLDYFEKNEQIFIDRYNYGQELGYSTILDLELTQFRFGIL